MSLSTVVRLTKIAINENKPAIDKIVNDFKKIADFSRLKQEKLIKSPALKYVLTNLITELRLQALAFQCWDELQYELGICSCFVHGIITDEGITCFLRIRCSWCHKQFNASGCKHV